MMFHILLGSISMKLILHFLYKGSIVTHSISNLSDISC